MIGGFTRITAATAVIQSRGGSDLTGPRSDACPVDGGRQVVDVGGGGGGGSTSPAVSGGSYRCVVPGGAGMDPVDGLAGGVNVHD